MVTEKKVVVVTYEYKTLRHTIFNTKKEAEDFTKSLPETEFAYVVDIEAKIEDGQLTLAIEAGEPPGQ